MYAVIPVTIDFVNLQYTGKSTLLQMWGHFILSKNALSRIVHAYGKYLCERGVVLNCVEPGVVNTDMMPYLKEYTDGIHTGKPWNDSSIRRIIRSEEIAEIIYLLMSNLGEVLSGSCILCGGGTKALFP